MENLLEQVEKLFKGDRAASFVSAPRILGKTSSGKPVYHDPKHPVTKNYSAADHKDAAAIHAKMANSYAMPGGKPNLVKIKMHQDAIKEHTETAKALEPKKPRAIPATNIPKIKLVDALKKAEFFVIFLFKGKELDLGTRHEKEHIDTMKMIAADVKAGKLKPWEYYQKLTAKDHLVKIKDYYTRLENMEKEAKEDMKKTFDMLELDLNKAYNTFSLMKGGEGSRGGKIIGHTSSGKPIYENSHKHPSFNLLSGKEHDEAADLHNRQAVLHLKEAEKYKFANIKDKAIKHLKQASKHADANFKHYQMGEDIKGKSSK